MLIRGVKDAKILKQFVSIHLNLWNSKYSEIKQLDFEWKGSKSKGKQPRLYFKAFELYKD